MVMTFLITSFGTLTLAAYGVGSNVLQVVIIPAMGLSMAISTLVGPEHRRRQYRARGARSAGWARLLGFVEPHRSSACRLPVPRPHRRLLRAATIPA